MEKWDYPILQCPMREISEELETVRYLKEIS